MFIKTKLYGNHNKNCRSQTLNWFEDVTLESVLHDVKIWVNKDEKGKHCIDVKVYYLLENLGVWLYLWLSVTDGSQPLKGE
jgi:hypothetical protein